MPELNKYNCLAGDLLWKRCLFKEVFREDLVERDNATRSPTMALAQGLLQP